MHCHIHLPNVLLVVFLFSANRLFYFIVYLFPLFPDERLQEQTDSGVRPKNNKEHQVNELNPPHPTSYHSWC